MLKLSILQRRRERYMIIHVWKILQGICPNDINMVFKDNPRLGTKVAIPPLAKQTSAMAKSCYDDSFAVRAGKLWNLLPKEGNMTNELESFKVSLGTKFLTLPLFLDTRQLTQLITKIF